MSGGRREGGPCTCPSPSGFVLRVEETLLLSKEGKGSVCHPPLLNEKGNFSPILPAASFTPAANINPFCTSN